MRNTTLLLLLFLSFIFYDAELTFGQSTDQDDELIVTRVRFVNNDYVSSGELQRIIRTRTNRRVLGIPGATLWYGIHRLSGGRYGEPASTLDRNVVGVDRDRLKTYYESIGFRSARIDTQIVAFDERRVEVSFFIEEGARSVIRNVFYRGFPEDLNGSSLSDFMGNSDLHRTTLSDTSFVSNRNFSYERIAKERDRIINFLRNSGYASVQSDSVQAFIKPDSENNLQLDILYRINPGKIYQFGDIFLTLHGPDESIANYTTESRSVSRADTSFVMQTQVDEFAQTRARLLTEQVLFEPGDRYNHELYTQTLNQYQNLGMLIVRQFSLSETGSLPDFSNEHLPVYFDMQTLPKHRLRTDLFGMQRVGFGAGAGLRYSNTNLFGRAELFEVGLRGSFEYIGRSSLVEGPDLLQSFEVSTEYSVPRLHAPFRSLDNRPFFLNTRTRYRVSVSQVRQQNFDINANVRLNQRFEVIHNRKASSFLDLFELDWLDASATQDFRNRLEERFPDPIQVERILEDFNPQFSSIMRYTFRHSDTNPIQRDFGHFGEASVEVGGNIPYLIDRFLFDPGNMQGTIPSTNLGNQNLTYSQFVKYQFDWRRYIPIIDNGVLAYRGFLGVAHTYGVNNQIPLNRRFFAGGSNDIRGWPALNLGPGNLRPEDILFNGGDIKIAGFMEYRHIVIERFLGTRWILAGFTDFGNTWYSPRAETDELGSGKFSFDSFYNEIAVGSGVGLRLDWQYVVFRIDMAYRIHDLQAGWFNNDQRYFHFGIGHSF